MKQNSSYKKIKCLFKGYAGNVYLVQMSNENDHPNKKQDLVVLKRYHRKCNEIVNVTDLNEYQYLTMQHENLMTVKQAFVEKFEFKQHICLIMDYMAPLNEMAVKQSHLSIFKQICKGLQYLHNQDIIHRDVKPSNIFVNLEGKIKLGDFGITKRISPLMTAQTCTKQYRAPELFFGQRSYDQSIDIWSLGCTLAEMYIGRILFDGKTEIEILSQIATIVGNINEISWPSVTQLPMYLEFVVPNEPQLHSILKGVPIEAIELIQGMLTLNPAKRPTIQQLLQVVDGVVDITDEMCNLPAVITKTNILGKKQ